MAVILFIGFGALSSLFSTDPEVLRIARSGTLVRICQAEQLLTTFSTLAFYTVHELGYRGCTALGLLGPWQYHCLLSIWWLSRLI